MRGLYNAIRTTNKHELYNTTKRIVKMYKVTGLKKAIINKIKGRPTLQGVISTGTSAPLALYNDQIVKDEILSKARIILEQQKNEISIEEQNTQIKRFCISPLISIVMPIYNPQIKWLLVAIESIRNQTYPKWELCIVDDGSRDLRPQAEIKRLIEKDSRIKYTYQKNGGISAATNKGLDIASSDYIALVDQDDELTPDALFWVVKSINQHPEGVLYYSDECKVNEKGEFFDFYYKPDWSPELLINHMYVGHLSVYKKEALVEAGYFRSEFDFSQDYDMALRISEKTNNIFHIERVLYYWRALPTSGAAGGKDYARLSNIISLVDALQRKNLDAIPFMGKNANYAFLNLKRNPLVSIVIPSDSEQMLEHCIEGLVGEKTSYKNLEIIVVTNSKTGDTIKEEFKFLRNLQISEYNKIYNFSDKCNEGVKAARGEYVIIYNDDVYPCSTDWIERMLEVMNYPGVGGVSPLTIYEDNTIQYAGMITGVPGLIGTAFNGNHAAMVEGVFNHFLLRDVSVLCGACMMMPTQLFRDMGGFDAINTPTGHSDVDISFRIMEKGLRCVYTPYATLYHIGRHTWNTDKKIDKADIFCMKKWLKYLDRDPFFTDSEKHAYYRDINYRYKLYAPVNPILDESLEKRNILIITHELSYTGAPLVLMQMIKILIENNMWPVVMCPTDGPLKEDLLKMGVITIVDESMQYRPELFERFARNFDLVIANTLASSKVIEILNNSLPPVLWWIHESEFAFRIFRDCIPNQIKKNIHIYPVSNYVKDLLKIYGIKDVDGTLTFGIPEKKYIACTPNTSGSKQFLVVGSIEKRKGQDIMIKAFSDLPDKYKKEIKIAFVGNSLDHDLTELLNDLSIKNNNILVYPPNSNEAIYKMYRESYCVVVPSRDEPMSLVAMEAMSQGIACICSDKVGITEFMLDGENGIVFENENHEQLKDKIMWAIDHEDIIKRIGENGKTLYKDEFGYESFKKRVNKIIESLMVKRNEL